MACKTCKSGRIARVCGKTSDMCHIDIGGKEQDDYVPNDMGIAKSCGGGDYIEFDYCLDCGQIQGQFPLKLTKLEKQTKEGES